MNENRVRQAVPLGRMRYVLAISLALVIGGFLSTLLVALELSWCAVMAMVKRYDADAMLTIERTAGFRDGRAR
jgi:hypothetical protein